MKDHLPLFEVRTRKLHGSPHVVHSIVVRGVEIHAQLSAYGEVELEERLRAHLNPVVEPPKPRMVYGHAGRPEKGTRPPADLSEPDLGESA